MGKLGWRGTLPSWWLLIIRKCDEFVTKFKTFNDPQDLEHQLETILKSGDLGLHKSKLRDSFIADEVQEMLLGILGFDDMDFVQDLLTHRDTIVNAIVPHLLQYRAYLRTSETLRNVIQMVWQNTMSKDKPMVFSEESTSWTQSWIANLVIENSWPQQISIKNSTKRNLEQKNILTSTVLRPEETFSMRLARNMLFHLEQKDISKMYLPPGIWTNYRIMKRLLCHLYDMLRIIKRHRFLGLRNWITCVVELSKDINHSTEFSRSSIPSPTTPTKTCSSALPLVLYYPSSSPP
jgi:hypothetical protein